KHVHWIYKKNIHFPFSCLAKTRYRQKDIPCKVELISNKNIKVLFFSPALSITPGQSIVFYLSKICLGGGIISYRLPLIP
ncbi:tRNA 2-thiouridine(34) synthase MnmA, partial [Buchnera aphidicola]|nr:tRNA 2-thiouridine(34) synthase MnmA [Buchnera aphidicola]